MSDSFLEYIITGLIFLAAVLGRWQGFKILRRHRRRQQGRRAFLRAKTNKSVVARQEKFSRKAAPVCIKNLYS
ncbi:MAG: hypothetical protein LBR56_05825 [Sporomusaceae bacterium]|jgi:hypothetical protein|nr:hypothetical protein [Sporomusaceae bacterium]